MAKPIEITDANFEEVVLNADKPVLVDFWATWCGPCRAIAPIVEQIADELEGQAVIGKLDVDANPKAAQQFQVMNIPTLMVFKGGEVVNKQIGAAPKSKLSEMLTQHV